MSSIRAQFNSSRNMFFFQLCVLIQVLIRILIFIADGLVQSMGSALLNSLEHLFISQGWNPHKTHTNATKLRGSYYNDWQGQIS